MLGITSHFIPDFNRSSQRFRCLVVSHGNLVLVPKVGQDCHRPLHVGQVVVKHLWQPCTRLSRCSLCHVALLVLLLQATKFSACHSAVGKASEDSFSKNNFYRRQRRCRSTRIGCSTLTPTSRVLPLEIFVDEF